MAKTRDRRMAELLRQLHDGPSFVGEFGKEFTEAEATRQFRLWAETWIVPEVIGLSYDRNVAAYLYGEQRKKEGAK
jgi:hypothetical protein